MKKILIISLLCLSSLLSTAQEKDQSRGYKVKLGDTAPDFTIKYIDGSTAKLSDFRGKTVMLQFTASWCGVCIKEMPHIESKIWKKHKNNKNFVLLGIDLKENKEKIKMLSEKTGVSYPIVLDEDGEIFKLYAQEKAGVTRNILINKKGEIVFLTRLFDEKEFAQLGNKIDNLVK